MGCRTRELVSLRRLTRPLAEVAPMFEIFRRRKRPQGRQPAASPGSAAAAGDAVQQAPESERSTDAEDFHVPPAEIFQEEEQDDQGTNSRLRGE
jgi:hypothetical protein